MSKLLYLAIFIVAAAYATESVRDCNEYLQSFTAWDLELEGKKVARVNAADIGDWEADSDSVYDGLALAGSEAQSIRDPVLEIEFQAKNSKGERKLAVFKKTSSLAGNPALRQFSEFKPREFFTFSQAGKYEVRLKDRANLLCKSTHQYSPN